MKGGCPASALRNTNFLCGHDDADECKAKLGSGRGLHTQYYYYHTGKKPDAVRSDTFASLTQAIFVLVLQKER